MAYTTIDKSDEYFNTKLYTGNGSATHAITGVGFQPDFVWIKDRVEVYDHHLFDAVRGGGNSLYSNDSVTENTYTTDISFNSDGFTTAGVGSGAINYINQNTHTFASWNWKANGTGVSNTAGDITSTVSANTTSGLSIVSYTGNGTAGATVGHGLGSALNFIIIKNRSSAQGWVTGNSTSGYTKYIYLNETTAEQTSSTAAFNNTAPTSNVFSVGSHAQVNGSGNSMIAYCFAEKKGFSKFGSYTGNGSADGTFIYTGFKPAFVMMKNASQSGKWLMMDNKRPTSGGNPNNARLFADVGNVESTASNMIDILSNGFKLRTSDTDHNASGDINTYMAFAENPFVTSTSIPTTAR